MLLWREANRGHTAYWGITPLQIMHNSPHSKGYLFLGPERAALVVGSSNFSRAGLATNVEMNVVVEQPRVHADMQPAIELFEKQ